MSRIHSGTMTDSHHDLWNLDFSVILNRILQNGLRVTYLLVYLLSELADELGRINWPLAKVWSQIHGISITAEF